MKLSKLCYGLTVEMIRKSGVREWESAETRLKIKQAALDFAVTYLKAEWLFMAITATFRQQVGTTKTWKSSGGDAAITLASLSNGSYRQGAKLDLGATFATRYAVYLDAELAATPSAGSTIDLWAAPSSSGTAGTDNGGGVSGTDAAYSGYSSNAAASVPQLVFIGSLVVTAQATTTVQKGFVGIYTPVQRYVSPVLLNGSGAAFHSSDTSCQIRFVPLEGTAEA